MTEPAHLDGNALGALFHDAFGREMTAVIGVCRDCGAANALGAVHVYVAGPGYVMRCPGCDSVLVVIVVAESGIRVSYESLQSMQMAT